MKHLLLVLLLAFATTLVYSQEPPAKANTITITLTDSTNINAKVLKVLNSKDYTIKNADKASSVINTEPKTLKNNTRVTFIIKIKGAEITLTGKIVIATQGSTNIEYKGAKGTPIMTAWEEMDKVAKALGGKMKYEIK
jgi:hypothetical protein